MATETYLPEKDYIEKNRKWHIIDARGQILGRIASKIATLLNSRFNR